MLSNEFSGEKSLAQIPAKAINEIVDCLRTSNVQVTEELVMLLAYLSYITRKTSVTMIEELLNMSDYLDDAVKCIVEKEVSETLWQQIVCIATKYDADVFKCILISPFIANAAVTYRQYDMSTPESIISLANAVAGIQPGWTVADIGCGEGGYLLATAAEFPDAHYYGYEIRSVVRAVASIRASLVDAEVNVVQCDVFTLLDKDKATPMPKNGFDYIFSNYPFAMRLHSYTDLPSVQELISKYPGLAKATSADWLFNILISKLLSADGKAICITTNGSTWNTTDREIRKQFVEEGWVEAVIALPDRMFNSTSIPTSMLILSQGNTSIRLVDATGFYTKGRRVNTFATEHIDVIVDALLGDTENSKVVSMEDIRRNDYVLNPRRYMGENVNFENGVPFESIIHSITRGAPYTASQLDQIISHTPTDTQYLMLANIQNGIIESNLPYLSEIDPKFDKYCVHTGSLILSKNGFPYKVAVAEVEDGKRILANGNLYIVDLCEDKADPFYVKAFLESEQGIAQLEQITVGATLPNIGVDSLKRMSIPLPPMDKQKHIAAAYLVAQDEVSILKRKLDKAQSKLTHIFDTESEE